MRSKFVQRHASKAVSTWAARARSLSGGTGRLMGKEPRTNPGQLETALKWKALHGLEEPCSQQPRFARSADAFIKSDLWDSGGWGVTFLKESVIPGS